VGGCQLQFDADISLPVCAAIMLMITSQATSEAWLFRAMNGAVELASLITQDMKLVWDFPAYCVWLGYREDIQIGDEAGNCNTGTAVAYNPCLEMNQFCGRVPADYNDAWLAGSSGPWDIEGLEVYYSTAIASNLPPPPPPSKDVPREEFDEIVQCLEVICPNAMHGARYLGYTFCAIGYMV
jgi:hypothetical protein